MTTDRGSFHVAVTGAGGMIGRKLVASLRTGGDLGGTPIDALTLLDVVAPTTGDHGGHDGGDLEEGTGISTLVGDLAAGGLAEDLVRCRPDVIIHLAAVVSGEAEADLAKGYRVNLDGTRALLDAVRVAHDHDGYTPRFVYASSIAVYGPPFPDPIPDDQPLTPQTSYGTQKAIGELLLDDYSRRGILDGVGIRLPTICVRPGAPNRAASGFFSSIIREPLVGLPAVLPVPDDVRRWFASPRSAVGFLRHAAVIDSGPLGLRRTLAMPGVSATVAEQVEALRDVAGDAAVALIRREPDELVMRMVASWAPALEARRARGLGFVADASMAEIIAVHLADELGR